MSCDLVLKTWVIMSSQPVLLLSFTHSQSSVSYLSDGHLRVLLLLLQLLLEKLQIMLRGQRREWLRARAAGSNALGCHREEGPSIEVLITDEQTQREMTFYWWKESCGPKKKKCLMRLYHQKHGDTIGFSDGPQDPLVPPLFHSCYIIGAIFRLWAPKECN